jgi:hypothetical protein
MKMESFVMPAWMAGIQVRRMCPETSMSAWIPALHAGMTESRSRTKTDRDPPPFLFSKERTKDAKDWETITFQFLNFVLFATFVVKCLVRFWLRLCRASLFVVNQKVPHDSNSIGQIFTRNPEATQN